jgi:hypothetical protein
VTCSTSPSGAFGDRADRGIGHHAVRREIPRELPAAIGRRLGEDARFNRVDLAVRALDPGRGDEIAGLDVGKAFLDQRLNHDIRSERYSRDLTIALFDRQDLAVDFVDRAADPGRRVLSQGRKRKKSDEDSRKNRGRTHNG